MSRRLRRALAWVTFSALACAADAITVHVFGFRAYGGTVGNMLVAFIGAWIWEGGQ